LGAASQLVPAAERAEWMCEWRAELWHAREEGAADECKLTRICLGSLKDAFCLRRIAWKQHGGAHLFRGSALQCLMVLAAVLGVSYWIATVLPGVSAESHPARYRMNPGLVMIQNGSPIDDSVATIEVEKYRIWKTHDQRFFDGFAFYRMKRDHVVLGAGAAEGWNVAHASVNLFWMLGLPVRFLSGAGDLPGLVLSAETWKRDFGGNPRIAGNVVRVGGREAKVIGVAAEGGWRLPGQVDAWLLEPDEENSGVGYVIAHLTKPGRGGMLSDRVEISSNSDDATEQLSAVTFGDRTMGPWPLFVMAVMLAFLALPAITSVSLGEYNFSEHRPSWTSTLRRWSFLIAKIALLLPIVYFASLDLAYWNTVSYSVSAQYVQLISAFSMCLFGSRWALLDQRQRCPVCLKKVTNPATVGLAGRTFLAWNGTELICTSGHTLLHVPGLPTSWFETQRWMYLDTSWKFLFAG
jgi:hypothetical protein